MESMHVFDIIGNIMVGIAFNIGLLVLGWIILLILEYVWSGMAKFIKLILFPGTLLHITTHYLFAKLFKQKPYIILRTHLMSEAASTGIAFFSEIYEKNPTRVYITLLSPLPVSIIFCYLFQRIMLISIVTGHKTLAVILAWLTISIMICGAPSTQDIMFIGMYHIIRHPEIIISLIWGVGVFSLGYIGFGLEVAIWGTLIYVTLILIASCPRRHRYVIIT